MRTPGRQHVVHRTLRIDPRSTGDAGLEVTIDQGSICFEQLSVDVRRDEGVDCGTLRHGQT
jgi:hypothetical protein